jgi:hypothetical protein
MDRLEAFLRTELGAHPRDLAQHAADELSLPLAEVESGIARLIALGVVAEREGARGRELLWKPVFHRPVTPQLEENEVWRRYVAPSFADAPTNVQSLLHYSFTEMFNNVLVHSGAKNVVVVMRELPEALGIDIEDDGEGIFVKLQREKGLEDPRHVALELAKGKLTTDPSRHTGEGIFFTAKMCDAFLIWSGTTVCGHAYDREAWHVKSEEYRPGTTVRVLVRLDTKRTPESVFDEFAPLDHERFTRTSFHVGLVQYPGEALVSRSQAKRLLARCDLFHEVTLDFQGIESIGPAFADEVFRVFPSQHPGLVILAVNANAAVLGMIERARRNAGTVDRGA